MTYVRQADHDVNRHRDRARFGVDLQVEVRYVAREHKAESAGQPPVHSSDEQFDIAVSIAIVARKLVVGQMYSIFPKLSVAFGFRAASLT